MGHDGTGTNGAGTRWYWDAMGLGLDGTETRWNRDWDIWAGTHKDRGQPFVPNWTVKCDPRGLVHSGTVA